jgi:hypothetical protein
LLPRAGVGVSDGQPLDADQLERSVEGTFERNIRSSSWQADPSLALPSPAVVTICSIVIFWTTD